MIRLRAPHRGVIDGFSPSFLIAFTGTTHILSKAAFAVAPPALLGTRPRIDRLASAAAYSPLGIEGDSMLVSVLKLGQLMQLKPR
jgi:hypothetical protein